MMCTAGILISSNANFLAIITASLGYSVVKTNLVSRFLTDVFDLDEVWKPAQGSGLWERDVCDQGGGKYKGSEVSVPALGALENQFWTWFEYSVHYMQW